MKKLSQTINLTRIKEGNYYDNILKKEFTYDQDVRRRVHIKREFLAQKRLADELHRQRSVELISDAIEGVKRFVTRSLDLDGTNLFDRQIDQIYGEILYLDMHMSDHEMTIAMIEKSVKKLVNNLHVVRLKAHLARKRSIQDLMEASRQSKRVFVIVEQAECLSRVLTEALVGDLRNRLSDETSPTDSVMVLFCLSIKIQTLPIDTMHCFGRMKGIVKHTDETSKARVHALLRSRGLKVKLAPEVLDFINIHSLNADASTTNINYLHRYCIFEHYNRMEEKSILSEKDYQKLESRHQELCDDMQCFARFLYEKDKFPEDVTDIYEELGLRNNLSESEKFFNAVQDLKKIPHDRLLARFKGLEEEFGDQANAKSRKKCALSTLMFHKERIINNKDDKDKLNDLTNDIMKYASNVSYDENANFYFDDRRSLIKGCFSASRAYDELLHGYLDESSYYGVLLNRVLHSMGQVTAAELCDEVLTDFKKILSATKSDGKREESKPSPPKRSRRKTTIRATEQCDERVGISKEDTDGLARAIFVDMIDSMAHQGIVKLDPRTKGRIIKRLAWPVKTKCD